MFCRWVDRSLGLLALPEFVYQFGIMMEDRRCSIREWSPRHVPKEFFFVCHSVMMSWLKMIVGLICVKKGIQVRVTNIKKLGVIILHQWGLTKSGLSHFNNSSVSHVIIFQANEKALRQDASLRHYFMHCDHLPRHMKPASERISMSSVIFGSLMLHWDFGARRDRNDSAKGQTTQTSVEMEAIVNFDAVSFFLSCSFSVLISHFSFSFFQCWSSLVYLIFNGRLRFLCLFVLKWELCQSIVCNLNARERATMPLGIEPK